MTKCDEQLIQSIEQRAARIGVIGLGYVGLTLAVHAVNRGFAVRGLDNNPTVVERLRAGVSHVDDVPSALLGDQIASGRLTLSCDGATIDDCDVVVICVPTPLTEMREPDLGPVRTAAEVVAQLRPRLRLVVLESTTYPGTTREVLQPRLERGGARVGDDIFLAYAPERIDPGKTSSLQATPECVPRLVGGISAACVRVAEAFYGSLVERVVSMTSPEAAELTKLFENVFRSVNIALVNELALLCDRMGLSVWEVIEAASTKPYGFMPFWPGPGWGGHCIPVDPFYLTWKARAFDISTRFIELAGEVNTQMAHHVVALVQRALNSRQTAVNGATIVMLGVAYKENIADYRESPALRIYDLLTDMDANVVACDPHVNTFRSRAGRVVATQPLSAELLHEADCALIITAHRAFDFQEIVREAAVVVDTRNATRNVEGGDTLIVLL